VRQQLKLRLSVGKLLPEKVSLLSLQFVIPFEVSWCHDRRVLFWGGRELISLYCEMYAIHIALEMQWIHGIYLRVIKAMKRVCEHDTGRTDKFPWSSTAWKTCPQNSKDRNSYIRELCICLIFYVCSQWKSLSCSINGNNALCSCPWVLTDDNPPLIIYGFFRQSISGRKLIPYFDLLWNVCVFIIWNV